MSLRADIGKRLIDHLHELKDRGLSPNFSELAGIINKSKSTFSNIKKDGTSLSFNIIEKLIDTIPEFDYEFVMMGERSNRGFASAGNRQIDTARHYATEAEYITESEIKKQIGQNHVVARFKVIGDSMEPNLRNGDTLYCTDEPFREYHVHVIVCKDVTLVKRLKREHRNYYVAMSDNHAYGPIDIYDDEITNIWFAKAKLSYNLSGNREDLNTRLTHIEQVLSTLKS